MKGDLFPNRELWHKQMGPIDSCDRCCGTGVVFKPSGIAEDDCVEAHCDCACGQLKLKLATGGES